LGRTLARPAAIPAAPKASMTPTPARIAAVQVGPPVEVVAMRDELGGGRPTPARRPPR
jgi:hypothetical protein